MKNLKITMMTIGMLTFGGEAFSQSLGINTSGASADPSSILDLSSTSKGLLIPRMTLAQRNAISAPATGLLIYQTDNTPGFYHYNGTAWFQAIGSEGPQGASGADGKTVLNGITNPTSEGTNGDFYINTSTNTLFGPKASGVWPSGVSLVGPTGATGATGATGPAGPAPTGTGIVTVNSNSLGTPGALTGDVTTTGASLATSIASGAVTYAKIQNVAAIRLLGNPTGSAAAPSEISLGSGLNFSGTTLNTVNNGTVTSVSGSSPISVTNGTTTPSITIADAAADESTKGAATFTAADFNATTGNISIDYTNGQKATSSVPGFLTSTDWTTFNGKESALTFSNGLTRSTNAITLGGELTGATTISGLTSANKMSFTGTGVDAFNVDGTTLSVDATNNRIGIGNSTPGSSLDVSGAIRIRNTSSDATFTNAGAIALKQSDSNPFISFHSDLGARQGFIQSSSGGSDLNIASELSSGIRFTTGGFTRARIDNTGLGIGNITPSIALDVNGSLRIRSASDASGNIRFDAANPYITASSYIHFPGGAYFNGGTVYVQNTTALRGSIVNDAATNSGRLWLDDNVTVRGNLGISEASGSGTRTTITSDANACTFAHNDNQEISFFVNGTERLRINNGTTQNMSGSWAALSDRRIKENIQPLAYGLKEVLKIRPVKYFQHDVLSFEYASENILKAGKNDIGFIAQDIYEVLPEMVSKPEDENKTFWGVSYERLVPVLVKAIQEQQSQIETLKNEKKATALELDKLKAEIEWIKAALPKAEKD